MLSHHTAVPQASFWLDSTLTGVYKIPIPKLSSVLNIASYSERPFTSAHDWQFHFHPLGTGDSSLLRYPDASAFADNHTSDKSYHLPYSGADNSDMPLTAGKALILFKNIHKTKCQLMDQVQNLKTAC